MNPEKLKNLLPFLYNHRVRAQSVCRMDALSRMYLAVNDLICVSAIDDYENRKKITHKINALYRVIDRPSASGLRRMYRLTKESTLTVYGIKDTECSRLYNDLLAGYVKNPDPAQELDIMACIVYELGSIADDVTGLDYYPFFQTKCRQWINELDTDGRWEGISQETAVRRLALLQDNSCIFRDDRFDDTLLQAYNYYSEQLTLPMKITADQLPLFGAWYDLLRIPGIFPYVPKRLKQVARLMEQFASQAKPRSDAWYLAISYVVVQCCFDLMDDLQQEAIQEAG